MILKYLFEQLILNARKVEWMEFLCEFNFNIKHVNGKENKFIDAIRKKIMSQLLVFAR